MVKQVTPSSKTENQIYTNASQFLRQNTTIDKFNAAASEQNLSAQRVERLKEMESRIELLGNQREIVKWTFNEQTNVGDSKLVNVENGYAIIFLTARYGKGLASADEARNEIEPILKQNKKAEKIIGDLGTYTSLDELSSEHEQIIRHASAVSFNNPVLSGAGNEPSVVGTAFGLALNQLSKPLIGQNGVYILEVNNRQGDTTQTNTEAERKNILEKLKSKATQALTKLVDQAKVKTIGLKFIKAQLQKVCKIEC